MHLGVKIGTIFAKENKNSRKFVLDTNDSILLVQGMCWNMSARGAMLELPKVLPQDPSCVNIIHVTNAM